MEKIKFILFGASFLFFGLAAALLNAGNVAGPKRVEAGNLAYFESKVEGAFIVFPPCEDKYAVGKDGKTLYFASKDIGKYTVIFAFIDGNKPIIETFEFDNGGEPEPKPEPKPEPEPEPDPDNFNLSLLSGEELDAAHWGFDSVIKHIDTGKLTTTNGARATFKYAVSMRVKEPSEMFNEALDKWTTRTNWETVQSVRKCFAEFKTEIEEVRK